MSVFSGDVYVTMQNYVPQRVASLTLDCNGVFAIRTFNVTATSAGLKNLRGVALCFGSMLKQTSVQRFFWYAYPCQSGHHCPNIMQQFPALSSGKSTHKGNARGQDYKEKHKTRLKTNVKRTVLNNTKLRHF